MARGDGVAEEHEVGDVEVERAGERADLVVELPLRVAAEAVDEEEGGFLGAAATGKPDVEGGCGDGEFCGAEIVEAEVEGDVEVFEGDEADGRDESEEVGGEAPEEVAERGGFHLWVKMWNAVGF